MLAEMLAKVPGLTRRESSPLAIPAAAAQTPRASSAVKVGIGWVRVALSGGGALAWQQWLYVPDPSGTWRTKSRYHDVFTQDGREIAIKTSLGEKDFGHAKGSICGSVLRVVFGTGEEGQRVTANCDRVLVTGDDPPRLEGMREQIDGEPPQVDTMTR